MLVGGETLDKNLIHIYLDGLMEVFSEHPINKSLVSIALRPKSRTL